MSDQSPKTSSLPLRIVAFQRTLHQKWRYIIPVVLLAMILMRLVWLQLRTYSLEAGYRSLVNLTYVVEHDQTCQLLPTQSAASLISEFKKMKDLDGQPLYRWFLSPGYMQFIRSACANGEIVMRSFLRTNQWTLILSTIFSAVLVRLLTSSWILAMAAATILLSRGHLLSNIADLSHDGVLMLIVSFWMATLAHYYRTGARASLAASMCSVVIATCFDPVFVVLPLALTAMIFLSVLARRLLLQPMLTRFRAERLRVKSIIETGGIKLYEGGVINGALSGFLQWAINRAPMLEEQSKHFSHVDRGSGFLGSLHEPIGLWVYQDGRWLKLSGVCLATTLVSGIIFYIVAANSISGYFEILIAGSKLVAQTQMPHGDWVKDWFLGFREVIDLHYGVCLIIILLCAFQSPARGLRNFFEIVWTLLGALAFMVLGALWMDLADLALLSRLESSMGRWSVLAWSRASQVLVWFEPTVLSFGIAGFYQLISIGEQSSLYRKKTSKDVSLSAT